MDGKLEVSAAMIGLYGAIGGAAFTLLGTLVTQIFTLIKDKTIAEIQQREKNSEREFGARLNEENVLIQLFEDCLESLAIFIQRYNSDIELDHSKEILAVQSSVSKLSVKFLDEEMDKNLRALSFHPDASKARLLREDIFRILKELSGLKVHVSAQNNRNKKETELKNFKIFIDDEYIKSRFKDDGLFLPKTVLIEYRDKDLTSMDREILLELFHAKGKIEFSSTIQLVIPDVSNQQNKRTNWTVNFDPRELPINEILSLWRKDYLEAKSSKG